MSKEVVLDNNVFLVSETKDGGYYWVFATVYPFESCEGSKGYLSCRRKASKIEIEKAEKLYKEMKKMRYKL